MEGLSTTLDQLGYCEDRGAYRHPSRTAIFVGDLIDRGPKQVEVYRLVRAMVESKSAQCVLDNHEFNAITLATQTSATIAAIVSAVAITVVSADKQVAGEE